MAKEIKLVSKSLNMNKKKLFKREEFLHLRTYVALVDFVLNVPKCVTTEILSALIRVKLWHNLQLTDSFF